MKNPYLIGTKVYLRPVEREDVPFILPWMNDPDVTRTLRFYRPMNREAEEAFLDHIYKSETDLVLGITVKQDDRLIGLTGLHQMDFKNRHASFGITIGEKGEWGKGYGTEATALMVRHAFGTLNLNRVWLHVYECNGPAIQIYEKIGFRREGVLRQEHYREGRYWDTISMALLREDWRAPPSGS
jgi:RimJ/RimL family protein N-acetyltransferase